MGTNLLNLPREIRAEILRHLVVTEDVIEPYMADSRRSMKKLSTKVLLTCKEIYIQAVYLLFYKNTFVFRSPIRLEKFSTQIGTANLAALRDLRIVPFGYHMNLRYQLTGLDKYDVRQEEKWDNDPPDDQTGLIQVSYIQTLVRRMYFWTFALPKIPIKAIEITIYVPTWIPSVKAFLEDDDPIPAHFISPDILGQNFAGHHGHGAKIQWLSGMHEVITHTGQALTFEDVQRLRHEMEACAEALKLHVPGCLEYQEAFLRAHRDTLSAPLTKAIKGMQKPRIDAACAPQPSDRPSVSQHKTESTGLGGAYHTKERRRTRMEIMPPGNVPSALGPYTVQPCEIKPRLCSRSHRPRNIGTPQKQGYGREGFRSQDYYGPEYRSTISAVGSYVAG